MTPTPILTINRLTLHVDDEGQSGTYEITTQVPMEAVKPDPGRLPDDAIHPVVYNRSCMAERTGGEITDTAFVDQLPY